MFRLFRRIRREAIDAGKVRTYFLYALGEIVLIVVGILLALQVANLDEERKEDLREREALSLLRANLTEEIAEFERFLDARIETDIPYLTRIYEKDWQGLALDSLPLTGTRYFNFQPFNSTYEGLKSSGELALITNDDLRARLIAYYEREHIHLADWSVWHRNFVINTLEPYMYNELYMNPEELVEDVDHLEGQLATRRLNSLISQQIGALRRVGVELEEARGYAAEIVALIDRELEAG